MDSKNICLVTTTLPMDEKIATLWNKFDEELQKSNYQLCLLSTGVHPSCNCDYISIPFSLDQFADLNITSSNSNKEITDINTIDLILREIEWFKKEETDLYKHTLGYYNCVSFYEEIINSLKPSVILAWQNSLPQTNILKRLASEYSIPHFILERGMLTDTLMIERDGNVALSELINNYSLRKIIREYSITDDYEELKDYYLSQRPSKYDQISEDDSLNILDKFDFDEKSLIVYFTHVDSAVGMYPANNYLSRKTSPVYKSTYETISELRKAADELKFNLIIKLHPHDFNDYESMKSNRVKIVRDINYRTLMERAEVMVFSGSTLQYEGLLYEKPTILLTTSELSGMGIAYEVTGKNDLQYQLNCALNHEEYSKKLVRGKAFINWIANYSLFSYNDDVPVKNNLSDLAFHCSDTGVQINEFSFSEKRKRVRTFLEKINYKYKYMFHECYSDSSTHEESKTQTTGFMTVSIDYNLQMIYQAEELISKGLLDDAENILKGMINLNPADINAFNDLSVIELLRQNYIEALKHIRNVLGNDHHNEIALENHKFILENLNKIIR